MRISLKLLIFVLLTTVWCTAQDTAGGPPISIFNASWHRARQVAKKTDGADVVPAKMLTQDNTNFKRRSRQQLPKNTMDPNDYTIEARSAAIEKIVQESRTVQPEDVVGYAYAASIRNDARRTIEIVFWEYRFTELANPANLVRRQFLCAANLKPGEKKELSIFSMLGPSDIISAESLTKTTDKLFDEQVLVNRIEYSDGEILQRRDWKYSDVSKAVQRATSTSWGHEVCRGI